MVALAGALGSSVAPLFTGASINDIAQALPGMTGTVRGGFEIESATAAYGVRAYSSGVAVLRGIVRDPILGR